LSKRSSRSIKRRKTINRSGTIGQVRGMEKHKKARGARGVEQLSKKNRAIGRARGTHRNTMQKN
jgi:hypothetical protein